MNLFLLLVLSFVHCGRGEGFFSKFSNRKKSESNQVDDDEFVDVCKTVRVMPRIALAVVGGAPLKSENSAPYIAAVGERVSNGSVSWFCGGSLISPYDVLTAAHCLISRNVSMVRLGSFSTKQRSNENDYEVLETIIHPDYKITESYNDVAVIKVKKRITLDKNIKPVCLPEDDNERYEKERARVIGWGAEEFGGEGSQKLQQVEVEVYTNPNCDKAYRNSTIAPKTFPKGIQKEQLCAGSPKGGKDACQGDSGGPLVLTDQSGIVRQIGIVSTGAGCGFKMYPGVYARVSSYVDWIQQQVKSAGPAPSQQSGAQSSKEVHSQNGGNGRPINGKETSTRRPQAAGSGGQSAEYGKDDRNTGRPKNSQNQNNKNHPSQEDKFSSKESSLKNEFSHNSRPGKAAGKHLSEYREPENRQPGQSPKATPSKPTQNQHSTEQHGNTAPGPKHPSNRQPGKEVSPGKHTGRDEKAARQRPNGINGVSSREQISARASQQDQLSPTQRPTPYRSP